jgi:hypothetical protein
MQSKSVLGALAAASIALLTGPAAAQAGPPGTWTQVTGIGADDSNTMRVGLARTADGVLHVSWTRVNSGGTESLLHSSITADGKAVSGPGPIFENSAGGINPSSDLVVAGDGSLRVFFAATNVFDSVLATATSADGGASWAVGGPVSKLEPEGKPVYAAGGIGAATGLDGSFYSIWGDSAPDGGGFHAGLDPTIADGELPGGLMSDPDVGVDSVSGQVVSAWNVIGEDVVVMPLAPGGAPVSIPTSTAYTQHRVGVSGRNGGPGVFVAYGRGTNPFLADPSVYRVDTGQATRLTKKDGEMTSLAAAPGGRLWVFWKSGGTIHATRSNPKATAWGRIVSVRAPKKSSTIYNLAGDAGLGPLDLLALAETPSGTLASWHQRIRPGLSFKASKGSKGKTVIKVTDAGQPVGGAKVKVKGHGSKTTSGAGKAAFGLAPGAYKVTTSKNGYAALSRRVRVK